MLPTVSVFMGSSLDGCIAGPEGGLEWLERFNDPALGDFGYGALLETVDALVVGRSTWDTVAAFPEWPFGERRVVVFTHRPLDTTRPKVQAAQGALRPQLESLAASGVRHVLLDGGALVRQGLEERVVDTLTLSLVPLVLGRGRRLFLDGLPMTLLALEGVQHWSNGLVQLRYRRASQ